MFKKLIAALALVPLAALPAAPAVSSAAIAASAGPAVVTSAATAPSNLISNNWAGRYTEVPKGDSVAAAAANWTAPKLVPAKSVGPAPYSVAEWVGIGGMPQVDPGSKPGLEQVGIAATDPSKKATPTYFAFYQMSGAKGKVVVTGWLNSSGKKVSGVITIKAGEKISAVVYAPNAGPYTEPKDFTLMLTVNNTTYHVFAPLYKGYTRPGTTAEVVTEMPPGYGLLATNPSAVNYSEGFIYNAPKVGEVGPQPLGQYGITMENGKVVLEKVGAQTDVPGSYPTLRDSSKSVLRCVTGRGVRKTAR